MTRPQFPDLPDGAVKPAPNFPGGKSPVPAAGGFSEGPDARLPLLGFVGCAAFLMTILITSFVWPIAFKIISEFPQ